MTRPILKMQMVVACYLAPVETFTSEESEYLRLLAEEAMHVPRMILPDVVAERAARSPVAL